MKKEKIPREEMSYTELYPNLNINQKFEVHFRGARSEKYQSGEALPPTLKQRDKMYIKYTSKQMLMIIRANQGRAL